MYERTILFIQTTRYLFMAFSLIETIRKGNIAEAVAMLKSNVYVNIDDQTMKSDGTALFWACWRGNMELIRLLLQRGASVNARNSWESTPLHAACDSNNIAIVRYLLLHGANADLQTLNGDTPCHLASYRGFAHIVQLLIENGASIFVQNANRRTCLDEASLSGNTNLINYIESVYDIVMDTNVEVGCVKLKESTGVFSQHLPNNKRQSVMNSANSLLVCDSQPNVSLFNNLSMETSSNVTDSIHWNIRE